MPYRGTNAKRHVVHDKSNGTIREEARNHFLAEKKEREHEINHAKIQIQKWVNDGFYYEKTEDLHNGVRVTFTNKDKHKQHLDFMFPDNYNLLKHDYFESQH